jgi:hypothetical protein
MSEKHRMLAGRFIWPSMKNWAETTEKLGCSQGYSIALAQQKSSKIIERFF